MAEVVFDDLTPEQQLILLDRAEIPRVTNVDINDFTVTPPENFRQGLTNFAQQAILRPLQERLGMRESLEDALYRTRLQSELNKQRQSQIDTLREQAESRQMLQTLQGFTPEQRRNVGVTDEQIQLFKSSPDTFADDIGNLVLSRETFSTTPKYGRDGEGRRISYVAGDRGSIEILQIQPEEDFKYQDTGGSILQIDANGRLVATIPKTQTPDQVARMGLEERAKTQDEKEKLQKRESDLRKEFNGLPNVKDGRTAATSFLKVKNIVTGEPTAIADVGLVFAIAKVLDPGSVVREGEFATIESSQALMDRIGLQVNRVKRGERLTPAQRQQMLDLAESQMLAYANAIDAERRRYIPIAQSQGVEASKVLLNPLEGLVENLPLYDEFGLIPKGATQNE